MRLMLFAGLSVLAPPALAQTAPAPATRAQAEALPTDQLADLVFRQLGSKMTAVSRPANPNRLVSPPLERLVFAGAPRPASVGLCAAMRVELDYAPSGHDRSTSPAEVRAVRAAEVYRVTGEVQPYAEVTEERAAEEARRCAAAGPVIPSVQGDLGRAYYFTFEGDALPELSLLVLQEAITGAQEGRYRAIACAATARSAPECRNPTALLGALSLGNLVSLQIAPSGLSGNRHVIRARLLIPGGGRAPLYWSLAVEADIARPPDEAPAIDRLGRTEIARSGAPAS